MKLNTGAVVSILILAGCAAAVVYIWLKSYRWMRQDHSRPDGETKDADRKADSDPSGKPPAPGA